MDTRTDRDGGNRALAKPNNSWDKTSTSRTLPHAPGVCIASSMISCLPTDHEWCSTQESRPCNQNRPMAAFDALLHRISSGSCCRTCRHRLASSSPVSVRALHRRNKERRTSCSASAMSTHG
ncbi:hypothetical protein CCMA1212_005774 [Trichoderma ghanense]|uniref:Uncharacterized protein n=1 Tax=Trichoderma ghanense TaxID=65468 RepID=A0ABY2H1W0_9HYPO